MLFPYNCHNLATNYPEMKSSHLFRTITAFALFVFMAQAVQSQNKNVNSDFVPEVGQSGKDVVWVPTPQALVDKMLSIAEVTSKDFVIDLGSGDGRTVITAAKLGARAKGIEYNPDMVALSKKNAEEAKVSGRTEFIEADLYETDLSQATVITMFLLPEINLKLRPRLLDLKPGTRIVSNTFTMGDWTPDIETTTEDNWNSWNTALMWVVPAKAGGKWKLGQNQLNLTQEYQFLEGELNANGKLSKVTDGRLRGERISFSIDGAVYTGRVDGNKMAGTVSSEGTTREWSATR